MKKIGAHNKIDAVVVVVVSTLTGWIEKPGDKDSVCFEVRLSFPLHISFLQEKIKKRQIKKPKTPLKTSIYTLLPFPSPIS